MQRDVPGHERPNQRQDILPGHIDVDLYQSTVDCLNFFYPRMQAGGVIISHDAHLGGVNKAFEEFFKDKPEPIIMLPMDYGIAVKCQDKP
ncbi:hypothetical protein COX84_05420 [Candidatus Micrarchaeota archaeon CG_4_10_14_0_2_um_filter_49_7]|nr:MAG: hypothetical protein COX84_05420 [Candidatus Micrarchaeota archaeon CG_4_10_14_0_2_um_filter_49_7]